jgi:hypothetical protein
MLGATAACAGDAGRAEAAAVAPADTAASVAVAVDTVGPMERELAEFRAGLAEPAGLGAGAADSREGLVRALVAVLERGDTAALEPLVLSRAEWAWLYFPTTAVSRPPYELPPGIAWFQAQGNSRIGALRALRDHGGRPLRYAGHACAASHAEGENTVWPECTVTVDGGRRVSLFGSILERGGRFKFVSLANDL